uniref:AMP-binding domain-containing protein n=2 Tax=Macrostomum lignano TaxID=282301 RepID=A0A1I8GPV1_9PLAT
MLSVDAEKTTENALQSCVLLAAERLNCHVIDFSAAECFLYEPVAGTCRGTKYYALFVELDGDRRLAEDDKQLFDQTLRESSEHYDQMRVGGRIDTMQVLQVKLGAFAALRLQMMRRNDGISEFQFKMPRVLRSEDSLRCLLDGCLLASYMRTYEELLNLATAAAALLLSGLAFAMLQLSGGPLTFAAFGVLATLSVTAAVVSQYLRLQQPCNTLGWRGFLMLSLLKLLGVTWARYSVWDLKRAYKSGSAMRAKQQQTLMQLVEQSRETIFGQDHGFAEVRGIEDFRARVPVRNYNELDKYNQLAYRGEPDVYFKGRPDCLFKTSGTTGKNKTFSVIRPIAERSLMSIFMLVYYTRELLASRHGRQYKLKRLFVVRNLPKDRQNEFGVPIAPLTKYFHTPVDIYTTPVEAFKKIHDADTGFYVHSVFALWHEQIGEVNVFFPTNLISLVRCVSSNWDSVLSDIENGKLSAEKLKDVDKELLSLLNQYLSPKPERAAQLRSLFGDGKDLSGFFEKAWPDVPFVMLARSGSFESPYRFLKKYLGNVPTFCPFIISTEGLFGINLNLETDDRPETYHPFLSGSFVEFIPIDADGNDLGEPLLAHELKVGQLYETVSTSFNCFRLRVGDVIKVTKMDGCAPVFEISHRKSHVLAVHVEKTTEKSLQNCVALAARRLGCEIVDFSATDCFLYESITGTSKETKFYIIFVELDSSRVLVEDELLVFDKALRDSLEDYNLFRSEGDIDTMTVVQVQPGAFGTLRRRMMELNPDISEAQFKMPRVLRLAEHVECLLEQRL